MPLTCTVYPGPTFHVHGHEFSIYENRSLQHVYITKFYRKDHPYISFCIFIMCVKFKLCTYLRALIKDVKTTFTS